MKIIRAQHLGMCFGVRDAISLALTEAASGPLTVLGDLVHNDTVLGDLRHRGIAIARDVTDVGTARVMVTAHGASESRLSSTRARGLEVIEATCPLVHVAHRAVKALVRDGYHPVIIGQRDHVEVRGLVEDLDTFDVILTDDDVARLPEYPRIGIAAQTTQPLDRVRRLVSLVSCRWPRATVRFIDTVCKPTKQRQQAAVAMARQCDLVIVIGGAGSNNTRELVQTCRRVCSRVHHVQTEADLRPEWFERSSVVGITAGTSTPDVVIDRIEQCIRGLNETQTIAAAGAEVKR